MDQAIDIEKFSKTAQAYYELIKDNLENDEKGKYVALDFETESYWIGETASMAIKKAKRKYPNKLFYLLQIGSPATFSIQTMRHAKFT